MFMATIVGETKLCVKVLLGKLVDGDFKDFFEKPCYYQMKWLKTTLKSLQAILEDVDEENIPNLIVGHWLYKLKYAVLEVDYLFDEISSETLQSKLEEVAEYGTLTPTSPLERLNSE
ncbi:LRR and NB-ARC domain disease resistance protein, partial [Trifolium medium]|nr:LRR and NB-ARC domain disease resistance protein [Trifolium medium]